MQLPHHPFYHLILQRQVIHQFPHLELFCPWRKGPRLQQAYEKTVVSRASKGYGEETYWSPKCWPHAPSGALGAALLAPTQKHPHRMRRVQTRMEEGWCLTCGMKNWKTKAIYLYTAQRPHHPLLKTRSRTKSHWPSHRAEKMGSALIQKTFFTRLLGNKLGTLYKNFSHSSRESQRP